MTFSQPGRLVRSLLILTAVLFWMTPATMWSQNTPGPFAAQTQLDCSDVANADSPACMQARAASQTQQQNSYGNEGQGGYGGATLNPGSGVPAGAAVPSTYNDTERLYVDRSPDRYTRYGSQDNRYRYLAAPEPLTEFQKLVAASTHTVLPIYGESLFGSDQPSTFAQGNQIPVTSNYVVGPGDEVLLRIWGDMSLNARLTVDRAGSIYIPRVGQVHVAGLSYDQLSPALHTAIGRLYRNFELSVSMGQLRSIQVFVVGFARHPGAYTVSSLSTLVDSIFSSGGPSLDGSMRDVQLKRDGRVVTTFDLYNLLLYGDKSKDAHLETGDTIYFPPVGPRIAIAGSVRVPAVYELKSADMGDTVEQALRLAGGMSEVASLQHARIERIQDRSASEDIEINLDSAGMATRLHGGDLLYVLTMVPRFEQTVTLRGNVANPGRYTWFPGMRVRDLIPDAESLLTRDYWRRQNALGEFPQTHYSALDQKTQPEPIQPQIAESQYGYTGNGYRQGTGQQSLQSQSQNQSQTQLQGEPNGQVSSSEITGEAEHGLSKENQTLVNPQDAANVGSLASNAQSNPNAFPAQNSLSRSAADIDWRYAAIERLNKQTLETNLLHFNLRQAVLDDDPDANLLLQPGDVVTVFSTADIHVPREQVVKFVRFDGEFRNSGVYQVEPGETLRHLVERVGGLSSGAYLYGSVFTREVTREQQQQRLDEFASELERQIDAEGANLASSITNVTAAAVAQASRQNQLALIADLHRLRATGRIVLHIAPDADSVGDLPNLALEDGDHFYIPSAPATVNVIGAVYNQNSFLFTHQYDLADYLKEAGGPNRVSDSKHSFLIRADGSVISRISEGSTIWENHFGHLTLHPGDTIVVPDSVNKTTLLRGLTDYSTVFSNFGLGAAAINVLR